MPFRDLPGVTQCRFRKGERIIKAGDSTDCVYYLVKGIVYRELTTEKGYESIFSSKKNDDIADALIGVLALYNKKRDAVSRYDFIAHTDCICYHVPKAVCMEYLRQHPVILESVLNHAMSEYTQVMDLFLSRREGTAVARLCKLLLERAKLSEDGQLILPRKCTNVEISKFLSVHKVTVSRMLRALKEDGCIERSDMGLVLLQPERLKQYADNELILEYE